MNLLALYFIFCVFVMILLCLFLFQFSYRAVMINKYELSSAMIGPLTCVKFFWRISVITLVGLAYCFSLPMIKFGGGASFSGVSLPNYGGWAPASGNFLWDLLLALDSGQPLRNVGNPQRLTEQTFNVANSNNKLVTTRGKFNWIYARCF